MPAVSRSTTWPTPLTISATASPRSARATGATETDPAKLKDAYSQLNDPLLDESFAFLTTIRTTHAARQVQRPGHLLNRPRIAVVRQHEDLLTAFGHIARHSAGDWGRSVVYTKSSSAIAAAPTPPACTPNADGTIRGCTSPTSHARSRAARRTRST